MSNVFFPTLATNSWRMTRTMQWQTNVETAVTGDRKRELMQVKPRWKWTLKKGILQSALGDLKTITDFYNLMYGRLDWFLWRDPEPDSLPDDPDVMINVLGTLYFPVAFTADHEDFDRFAYRLWECGTLEFEQVFLPGTIFTQVQQPHGAITNATMNILTSYSHSGFTNPPAAWLSLSGPFFPDPGGNVFNQPFFSDTGTWTNRTTSVTLSPQQAAGIALNLPLYVELWQSLAGTGTASFLIYDASITVTYADNTGAVLRPTAYNVTLGGDGTVNNPANAIDGDLTTAAELTRTSTNSLTGGPVLALSGWA